MAKTSLKTIARHVENILREPATLNGKPYRWEALSDASNTRELLQAVVKDSNHDATRLFALECAQMLDGMFASYDEFSPKLRISMLGHEPCIHALEGLGYRTGSEFTNLWLGAGGHLFEAWVRFLLRARGFTVEYGSFDDTSVSYKGIRGHFDFILKTPKGRRIICEVKHISGQVARSLLAKDPETKEQLSEFGRNAYEWDERGYLSQLSVYQEATGLEGMLIMWNKETNLVHVVPNTELLQAKCISRINEILPHLKDVQCPRDVFETFEVPQPFPQMRYKKPTGRFYIPLGMRYLDPRLVESLYDVDPHDVKFSLRKTSRSVDEILEIGKFNGYFNKNHHDELPAAA